MPSRLFCLMLASVLCASPLRAQETDSLAAARAFEQTFVDVIARAESAVVSFARVDESRLRQRSNPLDPFGLPRDAGSDNPTGPDFIPDQFGSGVLIQNDRDPDGRYVLTTCHVAFGERKPREDADVQIYVRLPSRHVVQADAAPVAADPRSDLAVLKLNLEGLGLSAGEIPVLPLGRAELLRKGRMVIALGNPYALARDGSASASFGMVSNLSRRPSPGEREPGATDDDSTIHDYGTLLQVDTRLNLGMSGGALLNLDGELVGITTSLAALEGYETSVGYAIPLDEGIRRVVEDLLSGYEAEYGFLGIAPANELSLSLPGVSQPTAVRVNRVAADSPAHQAGLAGGDIILGIDGQITYSVSDLMRIVGLRGPDAEVVLSISRNGRPMQLTCRLGKWPVYDDEAVISTAQRYPDWRGIQVDYPTSRKRFLSSDPLERYRRAVVVTSVEPDSAAARAGLQPGDFIREVDGQPVQTPSEFAAAADASERASVLTLLNGDRRTVAP